MKKKGIISLKNNNTRYICEGALIAVLYIVLTYISALFNLSSGVIQLRLSEALCILPIFTPAAIPGLAIGCLLSNLFTGSIIIDIIFGSIATLIGAIFTRLLRRHTIAPISHSVQYGNYTDNIKICISCR